MRTLLNWLSFLVSSILRALATGLAVGLFIVGCFLFWAHAGCFGTACTVASILILWWVLAPLLRET
jgi:hypothetical protein